MHTHDVMRTYFKLSPWMDFSCLGYWLAKPVPYCAWELTGLVKCMGSIVIVWAPLQPAGLEAGDKYARKLNNFVFVFATGNDLK